jgi:hypothetical protein
MVVLKAKQRKRNDPQSRAAQIPTRPAGLEVEGVLDAIGIVTGRADANSIARLRKVRGVADVSPDYKVDIGPPGAPISW